MRYHPECEKQSNKTTWNGTDLHAQPPDDIRPENSFTSIYLLAVFLIKWL